MNIFVLESQSILASTLNGFLYTDMTPRVFTAIFTVPSLLYLLITSLDTTAACKSYTYNRSHLKGDV
jgi:hypothetical protein